jgi:hypothetical protein
MNTRIPNIEPSPEEAKLVEQIGRKLKDPSVTYRPATPEESADIELSCGQYIADARPRPRFCNARPIVAVKMWSGNIIGLCAEHATEAHG